MAKDVMISKSFYSHHSAWGSYSSFIIGKIGCGGGFVLNNVISPNTNIYIGYKKGNNRPKMLPFFTDIKYGISEEAYHETKIESTSEWCKKNAEIFKESKINRTMKWSTEKWTADDLTMNIITPFDKIPEPKTLNREKARFYFCPAIFIQLEFDNSNSKEEMIGLFSLQGMRRPLYNTYNKKIKGMAKGGTQGFAVLSDNDVKERLAWNVALTAFKEYDKLFGLSFDGGLSFKIQPGKKRTFTIALASYCDGVVTTGIKSRFYYTQYFNDLEDVLYFALTNFNDYYKIAMDKDYELDSSNLNEYKKFMISHFTRSYMANTEFLINEKKEPYFIVNEGEYQLINTLDLIVDQVFWEMHFTPWTVQNELESYLKHYKYEDFVKYKNNEKKKGEICFCHDQGVANSFMHDGYSTYELSGLSACFSYMTHEQILNWLITACIFGIRGNNLGWMKKHLNVFEKLYNSIIIRDENNDGVMDKDSSRCEGGTEITTYDSLDKSLGQARNNLYLAVKTWAGYICLENIYKNLNKNELAKKARERSILCASTIVSNYSSKLKFIPAVFEENNKSKIIPAIEGLIYPYLIGDKDAVSFDGRFGDFIKTLKNHIENILVPGACINAKSGGWQLSSTSKNTWISKIIINQFVAEKILKLKTNDWEKWDKIHASWQQTGCSSFAATDQINSDNGRDLGSRFYPRQVSSILWLRH